MGKEWRLEMEEAGDKGGWGCEKDGDGRKYTYGKLMGMKIMKTQFGAGGWK